jgi:DNA polymerase IV (archaeal DinB-like DNA polymerase)
MILLLWRTGTRLPGKSSPPLCKMSSNTLERVGMFLSKFITESFQKKEVTFEADAIVEKNVNSTESKSNRRNERVIFHVDMDSFYASCELARSPNLTRSPFIVGADPKDGLGRGVVLSCNYPARKFGVRSGMPISKAWKLCPAAKYVPPDFTLYGEVSKRVMTILRQFTNKIEQVSIDEAYLDFTSDLAVGSLSITDRKQAIISVASAIKKKIRELENITCSIGVSNSKIVSKIATDMNKPDGLTIVEPQRVKEFLAPLPVERIPGIGKVTQKILAESFSIKTISDLAKSPIEPLMEKFGRSSIWFHEIAEGNDNSEVISNWEPISESSETTFDEDVEDYKRVAEVMKEVAIEVHKRVIKDGYLFRNVGIKIRFTGFETHTRSRTLLVPTDSFDVVLRESERLLSEFQSSGKSVRLIGVRLSSLENKKTEGQSSLLEWSS